MGEVRSQGGFITVAITLPPSEPTELEDKAEPRDNANVIEAQPMLLQLHGKVQYKTKEGTGCHDLLLVSGSSIPNPFLLQGIKY